MALDLECVCQILLAKERLAIHKRCQYQMQLLLRIFLWKFWPGTRPNSTVSEFATAVTGGLANAWTTQNIDKVEISLTNTVAPVSVFGNL